MNWIARKFALLNRCFSLCDGPSDTIRMVRDQFQGAYSNNPWGPHPGFISYDLKEMNTGTRAKCFLRKLKSDWIIFREIFFYDDYLSINLFSFTPTVIYDIGSNAGLAAVYLHLRYPKASVFGFEPGIPEHVCASKNYVANKLGTVYPVAVGNINGELPFFANEQGSGGQHMAMTTSEYGVNLPASEMRRIVRLEDYSKEMSIPDPDLIKMDIEGFEVMALEGMGLLLNQARGIIMETHGEELHEAVLSIVSKAGYRVLSDEHRFGPYRILVAERFPSP